MIRIFTNWSLSAVLALGAFTTIHSVVAQEQPPAATITWQQLTTQPTFNTDTPLLLTDGRVLVHAYNSNTWWTLTPDINGSYLNGTWTQVGSMLSSYKPLYFASAVLPDGRVIVEGGEYNNLSAVWTNMGSLYDPATNVWTQVNPPMGWANIGDSPGIVRPDGVFMMGHGGLGSSTQQVTFNASTLTWNALADTGKADTFSEEGYGLLPDGRIMVIDTQHDPNTELYTPLTMTWMTAGNTPVPLPDSGSLEIGPQMQRPNGTLVAFGGLPHSGIFTFATNTWAAGPDIPNSNDSADGPCAIFPNGDIILPASPGVFQGSITMYLFDGTSFTEIAETQSSGSLQSWQTRMIMLPTGQALYCAADGRTKDVELATSSGRPQKAWAPTINKIPATVTRGSTYTVSGKQFNGLTAGSDYGDDATNATNYPLVRITNTATHHVFYAKTHDHSTMGIATGATHTSTKFDVAAATETGASTVEVVANGIASKPVAITVQ